VSEISVPIVTCVQATGSYGRFSAEPLDIGFGVTLGNAMRRVLLSSLPGAAVTWVKVEGIQHEFSTIPHVREDVLEFLLNVKELRLRPVTH
jgi:DNA-directed RNA polymerase subunit alpha